MLHVVRFCGGLPRCKLPRFGLLRHVQPAHVNGERLIQAEQQPHEHVDTKLPLDFHDPQLQRIEIEGIDARINLVEKVALVEDETA